MTKEMNMMIMRFIERTMEEHMCMVIANYEAKDYENAHLYMERTCTYGDARKVLLNGGTKEDIKNLAKKYFSVVGKTHVWYAYNAVYEEMNEIEQFIKCGLYKTNVEREAENQQWISSYEKLPDYDRNVLLCDRWGDISIGWLDSTGEELQWAIHDAKAEAVWLNNLEDYIAWMPLPKPSKFK